MTAAKKSPRAACAAFCLIYVLLFCWLGRCACPSADDYVFAEAARQSFWGLQKSMYLNWTGRLLNTFLVSGATLFGVEYGYAFLPFLTIIAYTFSIWFLLRSVFPGPQLTASLLVTSATLALSPALNETLYWLSGMPYFWTTALMTLALALGIRALRGSRPSFWLCLTVLFLNGTVLETACVFQGIVTFLAMIVVYFSEGRRVSRRAWMAGAFWLASVAAFLVVYLAPGTTVRMGQSEFAQAPFLTRLARALYVGLQYGLRTGIGFFTRPIVYVFLLLLPDLFRQITPFRRRPLRTRTIVLAVLLLPILMETMAGWAQGSKLPSRAVGLTVWMMGVSWGLLWLFGCPDKALARLRSSRFFRWRWGLLVLCLLCNFNFIDLPGNLMEAPLYREECRERDRIARLQRDAGVRDVLVPCLTVRPSLLYFEDLKPLPSAWQNRAYSDYYGLGSARAALLPRKAWASLLPDGGRNQAPDFETLIEEAAKDGDVFSQFMMGTFHDPNWECPFPVRASKDRKAAQGWYERAAQGMGTWAKKARRGLLKLSRDDRSLKGYLREVYCFLRYEASLPLRP